MLKSLHSNENRPPPGTAFAAGISIPMEMGDDFMHFQCRTLHRRWNKKFIWCNIREYL